MKQTAVEWLESQVDNELEVEKLAEEVYLQHQNNDLLYGESLELRLAYKAGIVDGYNKAKETLYTEEEVLQLLLRLQQTESYDNLYDWFEQNKKQEEQ